MESAIGQKLLLAAAGAKTEAVLIAPFVKADALRRILDRIPESASVKVVARWIPGEILAGVCDLEIYDVLLSRPNAELFVHPLLHAKSYRFDECVLIGSANLTSKALGWACPANLEIMEQVGEQSANVRELERRLLATSTKVDAALRTEMERLVQLLVERPNIDESFFQAHVPASVGPWLPSCRDPKRLWQVYSKPGEARKRTVETAYQSALEDLSKLGLIAGLSQGEFRRRIATALDGLPVVTSIALHALGGLSEVDAIKLIAHSCEPPLGDHDAANKWEILQEWLLEFFPNVYRRETYPERFRIGRIIA